MKLTPDQKAGLYITAIVHLAVIIILLLGQIGYAVQRENSFVLDFTKQEDSPNRRSRSASSSRKSFRARRSRSWKTSSPPRAPSPYGT